MIKYATTFYGCSRRTSRNFWQPRLSIIFNYKRFWNDFKGSKGQSGCVVIDNAICDEFLKSRLFL